MGFVLGQQSFWSLNVSQLQTHPKLSL